MPRGAKARMRASSAVIGPDLAVDAGFAQAPGDELGHLAAEIEDEDAVVQDRGREGGVRTGAFMAPSAQPRERAQA